MSSNNSDAVIIGGGASGIVCAIFCAERGLSVKLIEQSDKLGKKILASGNGRCNLSNNNVAPNKYSHPDFVKGVFDQFSQLDTINFFSSLGLETYFDDEGRVYPISNSSASVLDVLTEKLYSLKNVSVEYNSRVNDLQKYYGSKIVICTGGDNNDLLNSLGVKINKSLPALVGIKCNKNTIRGMSGVRVKAKVSYSSHSEIGEVQFKDDGISGIAVMNTSVFMARNNDFNATLKINFLPNICDVYNFLKDRKEKLSAKLCSSLLTGVFVKNLSKLLLQEADLYNNNLVNEISDKNLRVLADKIENFSISSKGFYDNPQVHLGGIDESEIDENLSLFADENIFVCGEAIDEVGECGGYNLQWAWSTGAVVGKNIQK